MRSASASGLLRDDLHALAVVGDRRRLLRQVAEEPAMARRRPGVVQRPFDLDPLHGQPRPLVLLGPDLLDQRPDAASPYGTDANGLCGFQMLDELDHGRLVGGDVEVADVCALLPAVRRRPSA